MQNPGRVYSRAQLLDAVWGRDVYVDERTVDVHVGRLRKSLQRGRESDPIRTVRGMGYAFDERFGRRNSPLVIPASRDSALHAQRKADSGFAGMTD